MQGDIFELNSPLFTEKRYYSCDLPLYRTLSKLILFVQKCTQLSYFKL